MVNHIQTGKKGEEIAKHYLIDLGYDVLMTNWRELKYEIDIVALDSDQLVFVEVKTRSTDGYGNPEEAVHEEKQEHLKEGAEYFLEKYKLEHECRFDVISVVMYSGEIKINHIIQAF